MKKVSKITVQVDITQGFDKEEKLLSKNERKALKEKLNALVTEISHNGWSRKIYRTPNLQFPKTIKKEESSLYLFKVNSKQGVVLAVDNDPLFNQKLITLYRVTKKQDIQNAFSSTASVIYETETVKR